MLVGLVWLGHQHQQHGMGMITGATIIQFKYTCAMMTYSMSTKRSDDGAGWCVASGNATRVT